MKLLMSKHALEQARERGIGINEVKETIQKGSKFPQEDKIVAIYRHVKIVFKTSEFHKRNSDCDQEYKVLDKINETVFVITVMIRKPENGK